MPGPFRERIYGVLIKPETTSGVDSVPTAGANAIRVVGIPILQYDFMEQGDRDDAQTGQLSGAGRAAPAGAWGRIDVTVELMGAGSAYSASVKPQEDPLWRIGGLGVTTDFTGGAEFYRYATIDGAMETGTMYCYSANKLFKLVGCVAAPKGGAEVYKRGMATFTVTGKIASITEAALPALTLTSQIPPLFHSSTASLGAWNQGSTEPLMLLAASFDFGTVVADLSSAGATDGLAGWLITDRKVTEDFTYNVPALATYDPFNQAKQSALGDIKTTWQLTGGAYNKVKVEAAWSAKPPREASRNGVKTYQQSGDCRINPGVISSNREIQITYGV